MPDITFLHDIFVSNLKLIVMRKIIFFFTALLLPFFAFEMNADDEIAVITIPLKVDVEQNLNRPEHLVTEYLSLSAQTHALMELSF